MSVVVSRVCVRSDSKCVYVWKIEVGTSAETSGEAAMCGSMLLNEICCTSVTSSYVLLFSSE